MTTGLILIIAVLVLGGVIATMGDRIGMRVGKARLSLFNLRPRQTATLITILTGVIISATTFGLLFAVSDQLRTGVFELREIQDDLASARQDLDQARRQQEQVEDDLAEAREEQRVAQQRLREINESLEAAITRQTRTENQLRATQEELTSVESSFEQAQSQLRRVSQQADSLRNEISQLETERRIQIAQRDQEIAEREARLQDLESQRAALNRELQSLEQELRALREGSVVVLRNQMLASRVLQVLDPEAAPQAVDQLLREANRTAIQSILPGTTTRDVQVIQITNTEVEELIDEIRDGRQYLVRILSRGNYLVGEPCVIAGQTCIQVSADAVPNEIVFEESEVLAATTVNPAEMTTEALIDRIELLIAASQFRAQRAGVLSNVVQIAYGREQPVSQFFQELQQYDTPIEIQSIAAESVFTAGPLVVHLSAVQNGIQLFSTDDISDLVPVP